LIFFPSYSDVVSLIIALYAIKASNLIQFALLKLLTLNQLTASSTPTTQYTYGWHRAEILAALVNGVFLLALCFTITLEALERFFSTPGAPSLMPLILNHTY
jgi:zinc transporter 1